jgi:hypothetical protein
VASTVTTMMSPGSMARQGVDGGCMMMEAHRADLYPEDGPAIDGGDGFESESMRHSPRSARPDMCFCFAIG